MTLNFSIGALKMNSLGFCILFCGWMMIVICAIMGQDEHNLIMIFGLGASIVGIIIIIIEFLVDAFLNFKEKRQQTNNQ